MSSKPKIPKCSDCKHWKSKQAELEYSKFHGICTCYKMNFSINGDDDIMVLDRKNLEPIKHMGIQRFETVNNLVPIGKVNESRYCLVTDEGFFCKHFNA